MIVSCGCSATVTLLVSLMPSLPLVVHFFSWDQTRITRYPLNAFSKKQTSITMSSTESEVVAANQGIRAQGLPSLSLWFFLWMGEAEAVPKAATKPGTDVARIDPELDEIRYGGKASVCRSVADINGLHVSLPDKFKVRVMEDSQAIITILFSGASGAMRHAHRRCLSRGCVSSSSLGAFAC